MEPEPESVPDSESTVLSDQSVFPLGPSREASLRYQRAEDKLTGAELLELSVCQREGE